MSAKTLFSIPDDPKLSAQKARAEIRESLAHGDAPDALPDKPIVGKSTPESTLKPGAGAGDAASTPVHQQAVVDDTGEVAQPNLGKPSDSQTDAAAPLSDEGGDTEEGAEQAHGTLLVVGRRSVGREQPITVFLDPDVREMLASVIHPGSNRQLAYNELLRRALNATRESGQNEIVTVSPKKK